MTIDDLIGLVNKAQYAQVFKILEGIEEVRNKPDYNTLKQESIIEGYKATFAQRLNTLIIDKQGVILPAIEALPVPITKKRRRTFFWFFVVAVLGVIAVIVYMSLPKEVTKETAQNPTPQTPKDSANTKPNEKKEQPKEKTPPIIQPNIIAKEPEIAIEKPNETEEEVEITFVDSVGRLKTNFPFTVNNKPYATDSKGIGKVRISKNPDVSYQLYFANKNRTFNINTKKLQYFVNP